MKDLTDVLGRQAASVKPHADQADLTRRIDRRRHRTRTARAAVTVCAVAAIVGVLYAATGRRSDDRGATVAPPAQVPVQSLGGLTVNDPGADASYQRFGLDRSDPDAGSSPQAVVVRRRDGHLGTASAVVTYPVIGVQQQDGQITTTRSNGTDLSALTVTRPGGRILVRAVALTDAEIVAIANATDILNGRPVVTPPTSTADFALVATGTVRPEIIREGRYGCDALGEPTTLGGLCYTGLTTSPGFENALYARGFQAGPPVHGHPSVVSTVGGGNDTLAWEPEPGVIAYVGYSGNALGPAQIDALARIADRTTIITPKQWATSRTQTVTQSNDW